MLSTQPDVISFSLILASLALIPLLVVTTTSFLKLSMVMLVLRSAIGVQQVPPTLAIYGIALVLTGFIMAPTIQQIGQRVAQPAPPVVSTHTSPVLAKAIDAFEPLRGFMMKHGNPDQRELFLASAKKLWPEDYAREARSNDLLVLIPAFVVSELQAGYEIGFLIYIPFVVIDLLVSNLLMALGMQQVSPQTITIPLKLLLFTLVEGWGKLLHALAASYT
ncbi:type III secretion system export apparatus subunit SctR [Massilia sp. NR 4-1]|uniref:type III secretion system export apparatus subunit SctR n=1 Tax=Massilia sp. NR 4-1 TaxID=1678028 RepID=UPI00067E054A|nr:type III secretion system export apparatus subunit SctR [Massilia sp. NR 4-1]AKU22905.1 type III secretion system protein SsaR [Massilia sp. NR 4-1]